MNIVWQDTPGSFLDPTVIDAASSAAWLPGGDGGALWSSAPDGGSFTAGGALLWADDAGAPASWQTNLAADGMSSPGWQQQLGLSSGSLDIAWADGNSNGANLLWQPNGFPAEFSLAAMPPASTAQWSFNPSSPADLLWSSVVPNNLPALGDIGQPAFNALGGSGPQSTSGGLLGGWSLPPMPTSQLVWSDQFGTLGTTSASQLPASTGTPPAGGTPPVGGQPPLAAPTVTNSFPELGGWTSVLFGAHS